MSESNFIIKDNVKEPQKKNLPSKPLISILAILIILASFNLFTIITTSISSKSSNDEISTLVKKKFNEDIKILSTYKDSDALYCFYEKEGDKNSYGMIACPKNNFLYNRFSLSALKDSTTKNKFGYYINTNNNKSKVIVYGDFSRTTAEKVKVNLGGTEKDMSIRKDEPNILLFDFNKNPSTDILISIFDESDNELSGTLN
jgi:hypothetical protein